MKDAFMMSREEMLAKTRTDSEKGLTPEQVEKSAAPMAPTLLCVRTMSLWQKESGMHPPNQCWSC